MHFPWGRCPRETVTTAAVEEHPAEVLLAAAAHAQQLVVGSRGHSKTLGSLLASVSQYLAAHAPCPVVVIRPGAHEVDDPLSALFESLLYRDTIFWREALQCTVHACS